MLTESEWGSSPDEGLRIAKFVKVCNSMVRVSVSQGIRRFSWNLKARNSLPAVTVLSHMNEFSPHSPVCSILILLIKCWLMWNVLVNYAFFCWPFPANNTSNFSRLKFICVTYKDSVRTSQKIKRSFIINTDQRKLYGETVAGYCENVGEVRGLYC